MVSHLQKVKHHHETATTVLTQPPSPPPPGMKVSSLTCYVNLMFWTNVNMVHVQVEM